VSSRIERGEGYIGSSPGKGGQYKVPSQQASGDKVPAFASLQTVGSFELLRVCSIQEDQNHERIASISRQSGWVVRRSLVWKIGIHVMCLLK
jgi:hypothetical protein